MDYKRNYLYFADPKRFNVWLLIILLLLAGGLGYAAFAAYVPAPLGYTLAGLLALLGIALGYVFPLRHHISDAYIDKQVSQAVNLFEKMALEQLKIEPINDDRLMPVRYYNFVETTKYGDIEILARVGADEKRRTSQCRLICYFFTESKFIAYHYEFSLIKPWLAEGFTNYYYSEMSTREVHEVNTADNPYLQTVEIINK